MDCGLWKRRKMMRNSVYRISLEMHDTASQALLNVKKNDSSRQVRISITDSGKPSGNTTKCVARCGNPRCSFYY